MAKLADAADLKSADPQGLWGVQVPPPAPPLSTVGQDGTIMECFGAGTGPLQPGTGPGT